jgi:DNA-binding transcriptional regulator YbjK
MNKMVELFDDFITKAIVMTENIMVEDYKDSNRLSEFTENRERLMAIIEQISMQIQWDEVSLENRHEIDRKIEFIKKIDVQLLTLLQEQKEEIRTEIEQTFKQKENIKGYNLTDVK